MGDPPFLRPAAILDYNPLANVVGTAGVGQFNGSRRGKGLLTHTNGFQSRCIFRIAWSANFGIAATVARSYGWLAGWLFHCRTWDRCSDATAIRTGAAAAAAPGSSTQRGTRVSREETFDLLGSFLGCPLRISSAQLASLDSVRDRLIDLRWNPRLISTGQQCPVLK